VNSRLRDYLAKSDLSFLSPLQFCLAVTTAILLIWLLVFGITGSSPIAISICLCAIAQGMESVSARASAHTLRANLQWPKYLDAMHSLVWSGATLQEAMIDSAKYSPSIVRTAIRELEVDEAGGLPFDQCLDNFKIRLANPVADRFVELTRIAHNSGGRGYLAALRNQSQQLRDENAVWAEIQAKQNWVLSTAKLAILAPWLVLVLLGFRRETGEAFETETGLAVLVIGLIASLLAFKLIKALGKLPMRQRTLVK
jgi:tight adherence protein B